MITRPLNVLFLCKGNSAKPATLERASLTSRVHEIAPFEGAALPHPHVA
ncbi:hypothetical protein JYU29_02470 [Tianweitania sp. BSSL-BM11]|uniref:Protein-tyrosine-phosphatase n=1 Tax=Tianweitania aestuarii TaxID=2814886 RepID=A0ABS5RV11_9HYPH|nr:hypothetical protein [Tianweitania aestuarii]MBS9719547.1 hypothetical protein [Tianweitania aestuarii]